MNWIHRIAGGEGGGGGATPVSGGGNIFNVNQEMEGTGGHTVEGLSMLLNIKTATANDIKGFMESASPVVDRLFGKINPGVLLPTIDFLANARSIQPMNMLGIKPVTIWGRST